jgi:hypothetical protein
MAALQQRVLEWLSFAVICIPLFVPFVSGQVRSWDEAYALAANFTSDLSQIEKLAIMTGSLHLESFADQEPAYFSLLLARVAVTRALLSGKIIVPCACRTVRYSFFF